MIEVTRVDLKHRRLGDVTFAYGKSELGEKPALLVVSEDDAGATFTLRVGEVGDATGDIDSQPAGS